MKKILTLLLVFCVLASSVFFLIGCSEHPSTDSITIAIPDGGPSLGMAYLIKEFAEINGTKVTYSIVDGAAGIKSAVMSGEADIAIMPTNMAAILYNQNIPIKLVGTNSYGLLYMLSTVATADAFTLDSLKGKILHTVGEGGTPEIVLKKILEAADLEYVDSPDAPVEGKVGIKYHEEGSTIVGGLKQGKIQYAILGEPAVSTAIQKVGGTLTIVCDLQEEWATATGTQASYPQTALVAKASLIKSDPKLVNKVAKLTVDNAIELTKDAAPLIDCLREKGATVPDAFGADGVARANIDPTFARTAKTDITNYFNILQAFKPQLIGGKLPNDDFYYDSAEIEAYKESVTAVA